MQKALWDVESSRHADHVSNHIGVAQREIHGVISAETAPCRAHLRPTGAVANKRRGFNSQIRVESVLAMQAVGRMRAFVVPGFLIHRIQTDHLQLAALDFRRQRVNHAALFILPKAAARGGKYHTGKPRSPNASSSMSRYNDGLYHLT